MPKSGLIININFQSKTIFIYPRTFEQKTANSIVLTKRRELQNLLFLTYKLFTYNPLLKELI